MKYVIVLDIPFRGVRYLKFGEGDNHSWKLNNWNATHFGEEDKQAYLIKAKEFVDRWNTLGSLRVIKLGGQ